jgi:Protein of unknown function (DUF4038)/Putative collagen-binding domain of a collagenase
MKINTYRKPTPFLCAILLGLPLLVSCSPQKTQESAVPPEAPKAPGAPAPVFPVKVSANHRFLVDQNNTPFLIVGDSPQGLISRLNEKEIDAFWADRQAHGFNTMGWVDVLCGGRDFITNTYATTPDGIRPFTGFLNGKEDHTEYDLSKPNEPYFVRLDHIVELAAKHNILIFIDPIETAGWLQTLRNNGLKAATAYGEYLGNRYKKYPNVAWLNGNDFHGWQKESDDVLVRAVAKGIKSVDPGHIQTVEFDPPFGSSLEDPSWAAIITINGAYVYGPTYLQVLHNYNQTPVMPVFLMEAHYELEDVGHTPDFGTPLVLRREAYWTMLSGAKGQFYGNKYTWSFKDGWQNNIDTPGGTQVTIWKDFFSSLPWQDLVPDQDHSVVTAGFGTPGDMETRVSKSDYATTSKTPDGAYVLVYVPTARTITVNMTNLKASAAGKWFDPSNGAYTSIAGSPFANKGTQQFTPPGNNHAGDSDWVLLLDASK